MVGVSQQFEAAGLDRTRWSTAAPIQTIFREAFEHADLPYFQPHSLRKTLVKLGQKVCQSPEEFKAWSQNLGHEQVLTTFTSYGKVSCDRQGDIIRALGGPNQAILSNAEEILAAVFKVMRNSGINIPADANHA